MLGFLAVDKPSGWTSHDVVAKVRRAAGVKKVGHAGTLDPMATGLLVVAIGPVTRLIRYVQDAEKEYVASARLGIATDSLDADGAEVARSPMPVSLDELDAVMPAFKGPIDQVPPMVSAIKKDGTRLYELAREGIVVDREARRVVIHDLELLDLTDGDYPTLTFRVACSKGTYVRSLADDIAKKLGGRAHLTALRRTRIGSVGVDGAIDPSDLGREDVESALTSPADAMGMLAKVVVDDEVARRIRSGQRLDPAILEGRVELGGEPRSIALLDESGGLLAVYRASVTELLPEVVLPT